ncbi:hypothetical protein N4264_22840 [Tahibacter amnicola]|uniref:Lipoprotein n=1 Tax=Tahibacter amnicola TaxID=2976241 RepID=A0ABY6BI54_9GAMM|nr:DUF6689 family protein [Tahibacter amnicola]UXI67542.1 hypothetical protein N4264_22840 [Tahibacter amnicola]
MMVQLRRHLFRIAFALILASGCAWGQVVVVINGNVANATVHVPDGGAGFDADVTITFDTPQNLTPQSLNLTAQLVNPTDPALQSRLPLGTFVESAFPVMITVEPVNLPRLFASSFDGAESGSGNLAFRNAYTLEIHTHHLTYAAGTPYRLYKAPSLARSRTSAPRSSMAASAPAGAAVASRSSSWSMIRGPSTWAFPAWASR